MAADTSTTGMQWGTCGMVTNIKAEMSMHWNRWVFGPKGVGE